MKNLSVWRPLLRLTAAGLLSVQACLGQVTAVQVKDIYPGPDDSNPQQFTNLNGTLIFSASNDANGALWRTDGTADGTVPLIPQPGSYPNDLTAVGNLAYFRTDNETLGLELWKTDGTPGGTGLVKDIYPGLDENDLPNSSAPDGFIDVNGTLLFFADDAEYKGALYKSDGTPEGTVRVKGIVPAGGDPYFTPRPPSRAFMAAVNGVLFFYYDDGVHGAELWKSDGTEAGTVLVKDIVPGGDSYPGSLTAVNGTLFFRARTPDHGAELWVSDGTEAGTKLVEDIWPGTDGASPQNLVVLNGKLYFTAYAPTTGSELWVSDGTEAGTKLVKDIYPGPNGYVERTAVSNGMLFFTAQDAAHGYELWKSDGTEAGTVLVKDIYPGPGNDSRPDYLTDVNGILYFTAETAANGRELWVSNGTATGTVLVRDINPGPERSQIFMLANAYGTLLFGANDGSTGLELYKTSVQNGVLAPLVSPVPACPGQALAVNFASFVPGPYTARLTNDNGLLVSPVELGAVVPGGTVVLPANLPAGAGYRLRVLTADHTSEPSAPFAVNAAGSGTGLATPTTPARTCPGEPLAVTFALTGSGCPPTGAAYTVQLSSAAGSFANPRVLGTAQPGTASFALPTNLPAGSGYRVRVVGGGQTSAASLPFKLEAPSLSVTPTVSGAPACRGQEVTVGFNLPTGGCPFPEGNTFTVQLSSATGSFNNPTPLGTVPAGGGPVTIPASVLAGSGYRVRVASSNPASTSANSAPFQVKTCPNRLSAEEAQLVVSPNPATGGEIRVRVTGMDSPAFGLTSVSGRGVGVSEKTDGSGQFVLTPKQRLAPGVYLLQASEGQQRLTTRVLVGD